jgi:hypothetical protein
MHLMADGSQPGGGLRAFVTVIAVGGTFVLTA